METSGGRAEPWQLREELVALPRRYVGGSAGGETTPRLLLKYAKKAIGKTQT